MPISILVSIPPFLPLISPFICSASSSVFDVMIMLNPQAGDHLVGLVVKASASRAEGPGFESHLCRDFFGVESYQ